MRSAGEELWGLQSAVNRVKEVHCMFPNLNKLLILGFLLKPRLSSLTELEIASRQDGVMA